MILDHKLDSHRTEASVSGVKGWRMKLLYNMWVKCINIFRMRVFLRYDLMAIRSISKLNQTGLYLVSDPAITYYKCTGYIYVLAFWVAL